MQITDHIHALKIPFQIVVGPERKIERFVYVYLICAESICLIDSGVAGAEEIIFAYLQKLGRRPAEISRLVLTHSHPDHIGAARTVQQKTGCTVIAHAAERDWIENTELQCNQRPVPGFAALVSGPVPVDRTVAQGDTIDLGGGLNLEVIHTPGHSRGSISLFFPKDAALFSGDAIPVPGDLPIYDDAAASVRSIQKLEKPNLKVLLPAWGEPQKGAGIQNMLAKGLEYLRHIQQTVLKAAGNDPTPDPMEICRRVVSELGLPPVAVNPLVAGSFAANLRMRHLPEQAAESA